ncbi:MAG: hypothetical protein WA923_07385, partial [Castellaniella sp.]
MHDASSDNDGTGSRAPRGRSRATGRATLADVAALAGVSPITASRVVAGVTVEQQGEPGTASVVRIRGFGSNGNNDVLYVI